jgi:predicted RNA-binding Zn-ribbon protein involved in translation (DUF1610 family)
MNRAKDLVDARILRQTFVSHGMAIFLIGICLGLLIFFTIGDWPGFIAIVIAWIFSIIQCPIKTNKLDKSGVFDCPKCGRSFLRGFGTMRTVSYICRECGFNPHRQS